MKFGLLSGYLAPYLHLLVEENLIALRRQENRNFWENRVRIDTLYELIGQN